MNQSLADGQRGNPSWAVYFTDAPHMAVW